MFHSNIVMYQLQHFRVPKIVLEKKFLTAFPSAEYSVMKQTQRLSNF